MKERKLLLFVHLPPPVHGVAIISDEIRRVLTDPPYHFPVSVLKVEYGNTLDTIDMFTGTKFFLYLKLIVNFLFRVVVFRPSHVYMTTPPYGIGLIKDIPFVMILRLLQVRIIFHIHGKGIREYATNSKSKRLLLKWFYRNTTIIHLSQSLIESDFSILNLDKSKFYICPNMVRDFSSNMSLKRGNKILKVVFMANLFISKGVLDLFEILEPISRTVGIELHIIGSPTKESELDLTASIIRATFPVVRHGFLNDHEKSPVLSNMDLCLYPTKNDAFPLVLLEMLSYGIPTVGSNQGAIKDIIKDGCGYVYNGNSTSSAVKAVRLMIDDLKNDETVIRDKCRKRYLDFYSPDCFEKNIKLILTKELCAESQDL